MPLDGRQCHRPPSFYECDGAPLGEKKLWLQDDYVKFIRFAQYRIEKTGYGILAFITNHSYLDNPTFRGMRQSLMATFDDIYVLDLHGNAKQKEACPDGSKDDNVFDITQGVAIGLFIKQNDGPTKQPAKVYHADLWGLRESKYEWLFDHDVQSQAWHPLKPDAPYYFFVSRDETLRHEYDQGWKINEAMPVSSAGFITARDNFVVDFDRDALLGRIAEFADPEVDTEDIRKKYFAGRGSDKYPDGDTRSWKVPEARKRVQADKDCRKRVCNCLYRPFDERSIYWSKWMVDWPRFDVMQHMLLGTNRGLITARSNAASDNDQFFVTKWPSEAKCGESSRQSALFPLWLLPSAESTTGLLSADKDKHPNFSLSFLQAVASTLSIPVSTAGLPKGVTPEDIFHYAYAVFHSPTYRTRYVEFLKIDFPRLPLTSDLGLFRALGTAGAELVALHLLESPKLDDFLTDWPVKGDTIVERVDYAENGGRVSINKTQYFGGVPTAVWDFHVGGYQVCQKWLKDRKGRKLTYDDTQHYQRMVVALNETIRLMGEIDQVIGQHGGWPIR